MVTSSDLRLLPAEVAVALALVGLWAHCLVRKLSLFLGVLAEHQVTFGSTVTEKVRHLLHEPRLKCVVGGQPLKVPAFVVDVLYYAPAVAS